MSRRQNSEMRPCEKNDFSNQAKSVPPAPARRMALTSRGETSWWLAATAVAGLAAAVWFACLASRSSSVVEPNRASGETRKNASRDESRLDDSRVVSSTTVEDAGEVSIVEKVVGGTSATENVPARVGRGVGARGAGLAKTNLHPKAKKPRRP